MALADIDRDLLQHCLSHEANSWTAFVDRFLGLVIHVINHTALYRSIKLEPADVEDLASEVFLAILMDDYAVLRRFRGESSLATYLTVIARRVVVRELLKFRNITMLHENHHPSAAATTDTVADDLLNREEVEQLLTQLDADDARIVRMHYLEGKSYEEISNSTGIPSNSIGPTLTRAKARIRKSSVNS